jgi:DNA-binding NarL/FixJ family response regulator
MRSTSAETAAEAWLRWFQASRYVRCRAYLCATYGLEPADAEDLINMAALQVAAHWDTIQTPLAYFWTTLRRAVQRHLGDLTRDQQRRDAYVHQQRFHGTLTASTARAVADILASVSPRQSQLLEWFVQGYEDTQVATHLGTTPHAVRQARYETYIALRQRRPANRRGRSGALRVLAPA